MTDLHHLCYLAFVCIIHFFHLNFYPQFILLSKFHSPHHIDTTRQYMVGLQSDKNICKKKSAGLQPFLQPQ